MTHNDDDNTRIIESVCAFVGVKPEQLLLLDQSTA
jgi:hypothetical protein